MASNRDTGEMVNGKKHGYWITYYASGIKRSEGNYIQGKKDGRWIQYHKNGGIYTEAFFRDNKHEGTYTSYHENGNVGMIGTYPKHVGKSYDGKKEGTWRWYEDDGETVWRIITYKKGGARAKPDEFPLGVCDDCGEGIRLKYEIVRGVAQRLISYFTLSFWRLWVTQDISNSNKNYSYT